METIDLQQKSKEIASKLDSYVKTHLDELVDEFVACFLQYCVHICELQQKGEKDEIAYIHFSVLRTNILLNKHELRIDAYNESWYMDRKECSWKYPVAEVYSYLEEYAKVVEQYRVDSQSNIDLTMVQNRIFEESNIHLFFIAEIIRIGMRKVSESEQYQQMKRSSCFVVCIGGYQDKFDILYKEDYEQKDSKEVKYYLQSKKQKVFSNEIYESLDLSNGTYDNLKFQYSSFNNSNFSNSNMDKCNILFSKMKNVTIKDTTMNHVKMFDVDFSKATLENISFRGAKLKYISFEGASLYRVDFSEAIIAEELNFEGAILKECKLWESR